MNDEIKVFSNPEFGDIRTAGSPDRPEFCAKDAAAAVGYKDANNAIKQHCRGVAFYHPIADSLGRTQNARFITEGDLYRLIASSKLESARRFETWVFDEVLPAIRRDGGYIAVDGTESEQELVAKALVIVKGQLDAARGRIAEMEPKALFADAMLPAEGLFTVTEAARQVANVVPGVSRQEVFDLLRRYGVMCADGTQPTRRGVDTGRMRQVVSEFVDADGVTRAKARGKLTAKGIAWLVAKLAEGRAS